MDARVGTQPQLTLHSMRLGNGAEVTAKKSLRSAAFGVFAGQGHASGGRLGDQAAGFVGDFAFDVADFAAATNYFGIGGELRVVSHLDVGRQHGDAWMMHVGQK